MRNRMIVGGLLLGLLFAGGAAAAAVGDEWIGTATTAYGTGHGNNAVSWYTNTHVTFVVTNCGSSVCDYTIKATGTMVGGGYPPTVNTIGGPFNFFGHATLVSPNGTTVCKNGTLSWGGESPYAPAGSSGGYDFGQFKFPASCSMFAHWQYFSAQPSNQSANVQTMQFIEQ